MLNILIVDDSLIIRKNLKKYIASLGHNFIGEATTGLQAIEACKALKPDLITMDITMPDMDGVTAVEKIKEFDPDVNVIMITSHGQEDMIVSSLKAGAKGYILKPVSEEKLANAVTAAYEDHTQEMNHYDDDLIDD